MPVRADEIVREIRLAARPEDVFGYFTDPAKLVFGRPRSRRLRTDPWAGQ